MAEPAKKGKKLKTSTLLIIGAAAVGGGVLLFAYLSSRKKSSQGGGGGMKVVRVNDSNGPGWQTVFNALRDWQGHPPPGRRPPPSRPDPDFHEGREPTRVRDRDHDGRS